MRALILPASRTGEPDGLTLLAGKPLIVRQMAALRGGGATEIAAVCPDPAALRDYPEITCFPGGRGAASLTAAASWLHGGPVMVTAANIFFPRDLVHRLGSVRGALVAGFDRLWRDLWTRRFADPLPHAETFRRGASGPLLEIGGTPAGIDEIEGQSIGLLKFTPNGWQAAETLLAELDAPTRDSLGLSGLLRRLLAAKSVAIGTVGTDGQWGRIDTAADVALYERMAAAGELTLEG